MPLERHNLPRLAGAALLHAGRLLDAFREGYGVDDRVAPVSPALDARRNAGMAVYMAVKEQEPPAPPPAARASFGATHRERNLSTMFRTALPWL